MVFHEMRHFLQLFAEKLTKTPKHDSLLEKLQVLAKSMIFYCKKQEGEKGLGLWLAVVT